MSELAEYIMAHTSRGECQCGRCVDQGAQPDPDGHTADLVFFAVSATNEPDPGMLRQLIERHVGEFGDVDVLDGEEHGYIELGGWLGDQGLAMMFMGLASLLGLCELRTPKNMLPPETPQAIVMQMAQAGMVAIKATRPSDQPQVSRPMDTAASSANAP